MYVLVAVMQYFPEIRTNTPLASIMPVTFVVVLGMLRELLTDIKRFKEDRTTNARIYRKLSSTAINQIYAPDNNNGPKYSFPDSNPSLYQQVRSD
jgi:hypothetical protein